MYNAEKIRKITINTIKYAVIYARYSSSSQTEQSIDGQLRICKEYADRMGYKVINEYVDRAKSGTNTKRSAFQNMIADSGKGQFQAVLVYMVDRFARSKEDSVIFKATLRRNGVRVLSATEQIGDTDEGFLVEGLLEMFAEQYSTKLSKRVRNGLAETRMKGNFTGGINLLGFKSEGDKNGKKVIIDEKTAPIIRYAFNAYAEGLSKKAIVEEMNKRGWRSNRGSKFTVNSLQNALSNTKYVGKYYFDGELVKGYPVLIDPKIFERVQTRLNKNKHAPATQKAKIEYLMYGKAICGYCGANMVGISGTGRHGGKHYYYACSNRVKLHSCKKKNEIKEAMEIWIIDNIRDYILIGENLEAVANMVVAEYERYLNTSTLSELEKKLKAIDKQLDGIVDLMISNYENQIILNKLKENANDLANQKENIEEELSKLKLIVAIPHKKEDIIKYLALFVKGDSNDINYRRRIFDRLVSVIYLYDDNILVYFNILDDRFISFDLLPNINNTNPDEINDDDFEGVRILSAVAES